MKRLNFLLGIWMMVLGGISNVRAFTYADTDLLLIFRRDGFNDVLFNLGTVSNYLALANGTKVTISNWDSSLVQANYPFSTAQFIVAATTSGSAASANRRVWLTCFGLQDVFHTDLSATTLASYRSKIEGAGKNAATATANSSTQNYVVAPTQSSSYTFLASNAGTAASLISTLGGLTVCPVEASVPNRMRFYEIAISSANPRPPARVVGVFEITATGVLTFTAGDGTPANNPPTISTIADQISNTGTATADIGFTIGDVETDANALIVVGTSSDQNIVPSNNINFGGSGPNRTVKVIPASATTTGTALISIEVRDGGGSTATNTFRVTFDSAAGTPALTPVASPQSVLEDQSFVTEVQITDGKGGVEGLVLSGTSANESLVPNSNILFQGTGNRRQVTVIPARDRFGSVEITITLTKGTQTANRKFILNIQEVNDAPVVVEIPTVTVGQNSTSPDVLFQISDAETAAGALLVAVLSSSDNTVVPEQGVSFGGTGGNRTLRVKPAADRFGKSLITLRVTDTGRSTDGADVRSTESSFLVLVAPVNTPPTIAPIADLTILEDAPETVVAVTGITAGSPTEAEQALAIAAVSSNPTLIADPKVTYASPQTRGELRFKPAPEQSGEAVISVIVSDNGGTANGAVNSTTNRFKVTVTPVNDAPSIQGPGNQSTPKGIPVTAGFTVQDLESVPDAIKIIGLSSDEAKVASTNIFVSASGTNRTVTITPTAEQIGAVTITLRATDSGSPEGQNPQSVTSVFTLTLRDEVPNQKPTISTIPDITIPEDTLATASFTVGDEQVNSVTLTVISDNLELVPENSVLFGGSGVNRTLAILPAKDKSGVANLTVRVSDANPDLPMTASVRFKLTVTPVEDAPTIALRGPAQRATDEDTSVNDPATPSKLIEFDVSDTETPPDQLKFEIASSNATLVPPAGVEIGGSGTVRTLTATPAKDQHGDSTLTLNVVDEAGLKAQMQIKLSVRPVNDPPAMNPIADLIIHEGAGPQTVAITGITAGAANETQKLELQATTDNPALLENFSVQYVSPSNSGTLSFLPAPGKFGAAQITFLLQDDGGGRSTNRFKIQVAELNDPPVLSDVSPQFTPANTATPIIAFAVGDAETAPSKLLVSATSSNPSLVPVPNISFGGSGIERSLMIKPSDDEVGETTITVSVTDTGTADGRDVKTASKTFKLTVGGTLGAPRISAISDHTTEMNRETDLIRFKVTDAETPAEDIVLRGRSTQPALVPDENIQFSGTGSDRVLIVVPARDQFGITDIIIEARDTDEKVSSRSFRLTVQKPLSPPVISQIPNQTIRQDRSTAALPFTVSDKETAAGFLSVTVSSSNLSLVPEENILLGGTGRNRTVRVTPAAGRSGTAKITLAVTDADGSTTTTSFTLAVESNDTPPTLSAIPDQRTIEGRPTDIVMLSVADLETPPDFLRLAATSSNPALVPANSVFFGGRGSSRTLFVRPEAGQLGSAVITVRVTDGAGKFTETAFAVTVTSPSASAPGDFNGDGSADLIFQDARGRLGVWFMNGPDLQSAAALDPEAVDFGWRVVGSSDLDEDGSPDLVLQHEDGTLTSWLMEGVRFRTQLALNPSQISRNWRAIGLADFDGDSRNDLLFQHTDGTLAIWYLDGVNLLTSTLIDPADPGEGWHSVACGDFNADQRADVLFQHIDGTLAVWYLDGKDLTTATFVNPSHPGDSNWRVEDCLDLNADGQVDLLFQHRVLGTLAVWFMNGVDLTSPTLLNPAQPGGSWKLPAP